MSGDSRVSSYPDAWEFEFSDVIRTVYVRRSTLYTVRLGRNPVGYFGGEIIKSRQFVGGF
jgi:hypothetical protein